MYIVDVSDPSNPKQLPTWQFLGDGRPHDVNLNAAGTRLYAGQPGLFRQRRPLDRSKRAGDPGCQRLSVPSPQSADPDYQQALLGGPAGKRSRCSPSPSTGAQHIISTDESGGQGALGVSRPHVRGGRPRMVLRRSSTSRDERNPKIVSKLMLEVSDPANCELLINDPPEAGGGPLDYSGERCNVDRANNPTMVACGFRDAGLRVFDIRDPYRPKEIAYYKPPAMRTAFLPGSGSWAPGGDRTVDRIAGFPRFVKVPANEEHGRELQIWFVSDDNGFQIVHFTRHFPVKGKIATKGTFSRTRAR